MLAQRGAACPLCRTPLQLDAMARAARPGAVPPRRAAGGPPRQFGQPGPARERAAPREAGVAVDEFFRAAPTTNATAVQDGRERTLGRILDLQAAQDAQHGREPLAHPVGCNPSLDAIHHWHLPGIGLQGITIGSPVIPPRREPTPPSAAPAPQPASAETTPQTPSGCQLLTCNCRCSDYGTSLVSLAYRWLVLIVAACILFFTIASTPAGAERWMLIYIGGPSVLCVTLYNSRYTTANCDTIQQHRAVSPRRLAQYM